MKMEKMTKTRISIRELSSDRINIEASYILKILAQKYLQNVIISWGLSANYTFGESEVTSYKDYAVSSCTI